MKPPLPLPGRPGPAAASAARHAAAAARPDQPQRTASSDPALALRPFEATDAAAVLAHVLSIQQREFGLPITAADQPDLLDVPGHYQRGRGGFWVAQDGPRVVGSIGLLDIGGADGVLRKMFVAAEARGGAGGSVAARLLQALRQHARARGLRRVWLGTTEAMTAAHRFYERQGFERVEAGALPPAFPRMVVDTRFYRCTTSRGAGC